MYFSLEYENGFVVTLTQIWEDGRLHAKPLRKFKEQGDAMVFKLHDCPNLTELQIRMCVKTYDRNKKFIRIDERHFRFSVEF